MVVLFTLVLCENRAEKAYIGIWICSAPMAMETERKLTGVITVECVYEFLNIKLLLLGFLEVLQVPSILTGKNTIDID